MDNRGLGHTKMLDRKSFHIQTILMLAQILLDVYQFFMALGKNAAVLFTRLGIWIKAEPTAQFLKQFKMQLSNLELQGVYFNGY